MICVSIGKIAFKDALRAVKKFPFLELRLDLLNFSPEEVRKLISKNNNIIATCRPGKHSDEERKSLLEEALKAGARYIDVEIETHAAFKKELITLARKMNSKVILSYHHFKKTPSRNELDEISRQCFKEKADIAKVACLVNKQADVANILSLYANHKEIVAFGMGPLGTFSRIACLFLGAPFTYASLSKEKKTAPGQITYKELEHISEAIKHA